MRRGFLSPGTADIGGTAVEDDVEGGAAVVVHELLDFVPSLGLGDLLQDGDGTADGVMGERSTAE